MLKPILLAGVLLTLCTGTLIAANATAEDTVVKGHDLKKSYDCKGNNVIVDANDSVLTFRGECNQITVNGSTNTITVDAVASIVLNSGDNTIRWKKGAKPKVVDKSSGNKVEQVK